MLGCPDQFYCPGGHHAPKSLLTSDLLDVESGKVYSSVATLESASALNLKGCVAMVLCKGETWRKVK